MYKTEDYLEPPFQFAIPGNEDHEISLYETYWLDKYINWLLLNRTKPQFVNVMTGDSLNTDPRGDVFYSSNRIITNQYYSQALNKLKDNNEMNDILSELASIFILFIIYI